MSLLLRLASECTSSVKAELSVLDLRELRRVIEVSPSRRISETRRPPKRRSEVGGSKLWWTCDWKDVAILVVVCMCCVNVCVWCPGARTYSPFMIFTKIGHVRMISDVYVLHRIVSWDDTISQKFNIVFKRIRKPNYHRQAVD